MAYRSLLIIAIIAILGVGCKKTSSSTPGRGSFTINGTTYSGTCTLSTGGAADDTLGQVEILDDQNRAYINIDNIPRGTGTFTIGNYHADQFGNDYQHLRCFAYIENGSSTGYGSTDGCGTLVKTGPKTFTLTYTGVLTNGFPTPASGTTGAMTASGSYY